MSTTERPATAQSPSTVSGAEQDVCCIEKKKHQNLGPLTQEATARWQTQETWLLSPALRTYLKGTLDQIRLGQVLNLGTADVLAGSFWEVLFIYLFFGGDTPFYVLSGVECDKHVTNM